ncbi:MAG: FAD-dependent oxidoreductase [Ilumatobacteraceae bacterium]
MRLIVVGAGLAGLSAAGRLTAAGHDVTVFERSRGPGGRMATRRIGPATLDHGAQFLTVRSSRFTALVSAWIAEDLVFEWCRGFTEPADGFPRYAVRGGMNALPKLLARGLDVRYGALVFAVARIDGGWEVLLDDGSRHRCDGLVLTCPVPQSFSLLVTAEVELPEVLVRTDYDRTLCLLAVLDRPSAVPAPGGLQGVPDLTFVGDNQAKGISAVPALTVHADPAWSGAWWSADRVATADALLALVAPFVGDARVVAHQVKRWRFATPQTIWPEPCWAAPSGPPVVLAGDAFAGPRVEGAVLSGLAAADVLIAG